MIQLRRTCNVFVTMNPGYAGRQELPDNLKALFRSVAMMVPDYAQIGQIILYSMGYLNGFELARKIVMTYKLCSEQLSSQRHYDYGMRAVMAVLRAAGNLKRAQPEEDESILCLRAITDVNLPKFLAPDVPLFNGIVADLFPGVKLPEVDNSIMEGVMLEICAQRNLQPTDYFISKVFEIYEMMIVRHGFMVVGLPFAAKTSALKVLADTLTELHVRYPEDAKFNKVYHTIINPKSITMGQLYGQFDPVSHEWTDGVLAISYRNYAADPPKIGNPEDRKWVWFDGPVDAIWIENMNTVLDDNKKLCLMSGEMVIMSNSMSMIFEPMDLEVASPATVSRVGVIYMEPHRMTWIPCMESWLDNWTRSKYPEVEESEEADKDELNLGNTPPKKWGFSDEQRKLLADLMRFICDPCMCFVRRNCVEQVPTLDQTLVQAMMRLMESIFDLVPELDEEIIASTMLFSLVWSLGASVDAQGRQKFDGFLRSLVKDPDGVLDAPENKAVKTLLLLKKYTNPFQGCPYEFENFIPATGSVYDFCYDTTSKKWVSWESRLKKDVIPAEASFNSILVSTTTTAQMDFIVEHLVANKFPVLVVGPTGTGKSVVVNKILSQTLSQETYKPIFVNFTAKTTANQTQDIIDGKLDKRRKGIYGPPLGCRSVIFVDDFSMPEVEEYGAQPPIELVRQLLDNGGWYNLKDMAFMEIIDASGSGNGPARRGRK